MNKNYISIFLRNISKKISPKLHKLKNKFLRYQTVLFLVILYSLGIGLSYFLTRLFRKKIMLTAAKWQVATGSVLDRKMY